MDTMNVGDVVSYWQEDPDDDGRDALFKTQAEALMQSAATPQERNLVWRALELGYQHGAYDYHPDDLMQPVPVRYRSAMISGFDDTVDPPRVVFFGDEA